MFAAEEYPLHIDRLHFLPFPLSGLNEGLHREDAGIVDQNVQTARFGRDKCHSRSPCRLVCNIQLECEPVNLRREIRTICTIRQNDAGAGSCHGSDRCRPDTTGGAGH